MTMIKKIINLFLAMILLLVFATFALADQALWVTKAQSESAVKLLKDNKLVKHFCAPCKDTEVISEDIESIKSAKIENEDYWYVLINEKEVDLAYLYFQNDEKKWKNVAIELKIEVTDVPEFLDDNTTKSASAPNPSLPKFGKNESYKTVRLKMIKAGWKPYHSPEADVCAKGDLRCQGRPEMEACAGTGMANCNFLWKRKDATVAISTLGEGRNNTVSGWGFRE